MTDDWTPTKLKHRKGWTIALVGGQWHWFINEAHQGWSPTCEEAMVALEEALEDISYGVQT